MTLTSSFEDSSTISKISSVSGSSSLVDGPLAVVDVPETVESPSRVVAEVVVVEGASVVVTVVPNVLLDTSENLDISNSAAKANTLMLHETCTAGPYIRLSKDVRWRVK